MANRIAAARPKLRRLTNATGTFELEGQTYSAYDNGAPPVCRICGQPEGGPRLCYYCGNGIEQNYPTLRRERIETLKKQLAILEAAALEDMWRMTR
jgi:hypothetical protein